MNKRPTTFVVQRSKWLRGAFGEASTLLNAQGRSCCLGFVARQCGVADERMLNKHRPSDTRETDRLGGVLVKLTDGTDTALTRTAMAINDSGVFNDPEREAQLTQLFKRAGYTLRFVP
jgi:hypothetical protein